VTRRARFEPSGPLQGTYTPPADKSISHRAAMFAAMSDEPVAVRNYLRSADTESTLSALQSLGAGVEDDGDGVVLVRGVGLHAPLEATGGLLDVGNSGTLMRLLPGWLAGQPGRAWTLDGDESIRRRPVDRVAEPLAAMGAGLEAREDRFPPLTVTGAELVGIEYRLPVASAQVKSCVLIAGMLADGSTTVVEPGPSRDHTERLMRRAHVPFQSEKGRLTVTQVDEIELDEVVVPGDPSSAAFIVAAAMLVPGSRVVVSGMGLNWTRTAFFRIVQRMGAVVVCELEEPGTETDAEPIGELDVASGVLEGTEVGPDEVPLAIDELTLVALLGACAEGETVVRGAAELRLKESDRIAAVVGGLSGLGADIEETEDGFVVRGDGSPLAGGTIDALGDHRLAMLGAVAGLASTGGVEVVGMDSAAVSYPGFEADLAALIS
jgi:3-phosphoshikimate 1-carboxyvinyltransferase